MFGKTTPTKNRRPCQKIRDLAIDMKTKPFVLDRRTNGDMAFTVWSAQALPGGIKNSIDEDGDDEMEIDQEDTDEEEQEDEEDEEDVNQAGIE